MTGVILQESITDLKTIIAIPPLQFMASSPKKHHLLDSSRPSLGDLDEDILIRIFEMGSFSAKEKCRLACVSKLWKRILDSPCFWKTLEIEDERMCLGLGTVPSRYSELRELFIQDPNNDLHAYNSIISASHQSLKSISINCDKNDIVGNEASISSILWILSLYCKCIESISLVSDGREGVLGHLENKTMWFLTTGFRNVTRFASMCHNSMTKQCIFLIVIAWRDIANLKMHCGSMNLEDIYPLKKCHKLLSIEFIGCRSSFFSAIPIGTILHHEVEEITLTSMMCTMDDILALCRACPSLKEIRLHKWSYFDESLDDFKVRLRGLRKLKAMFAKEGFSLKFD